MLSKHGRIFKARGFESTRAPQEIAVTHKLSTRATRGGGYGRIVVAGVGDGDTIGDMVGAGWAVAATVVAPTMHELARMRPTNHRFM